MQTSAFRRRTVVAGSSMQTFEFGPPARDPGIRADEDDTFLQIDGTDGTIVRATMTGLVVCQCRTTSPVSSHGHRHWKYGELDDIRIDAYGPIGVVRATIRERRTDL